MNFWGTVKSHSKDRVILVPFHDLGLIMFRHTTMTQQNWTYYRKHNIPNRKHCPFLGMLFSKYAAFASFNSSRVQPILYKT